MKITIAILLLIIGGLNCSAQKFVSLKECIEYAMAHNLEIRQQEITVREKETEYVKAVFSHLPTVALYGIGELGKGETYETKNYGFTAEGEWVLFAGFSRQYNRMAAKLETEAARLDDDKLRNNIALNITRAYLQVLLSEELAECAKAEYSNILGEKDRVLALVKAGKQPFSARFNIEAQCSTEMSDLVSAECDLRSSIMELVQILDVPYDSSFRTKAIRTTELPLPPTVTYGEIEDFALSRPEMLSLRKTEESRARSLEAAKGAAAPTISLTASYGMSKLTGTSQERSVGIELSIPLLDGYVSAARIKESRLELSRATLERKQQTLKMVSTIQSAIIEAGNLYSIVTASQKRLSASESLLSASSAKFHAGGITAAEYSQARTDYLTARSEAIRNKWKYVFQLKIVDYYRGLPIELDQ